MIQNGDDILTYEELLKQSDSEKLIVKEKDLPGYNGRIYKNRVAINRDIATTVEKSCVLAEELGHYYTSSGDILDQSKPENRKQEHHARLWAYNKMITMDKLANARKSGCRNRYEIAEYLDVTEEFLQEAIDSYKEIYGDGYHQYGDYLICFEPLNIYHITE